MPHWDYQSVLHLRGGVRINRSSLLQACRLGAESRLAVVVLAQSNHTRFEGVVHRVEVPVRDSVDLALLCVLPGRELGGRLNLQTFLVATKPCPLDGMAARSPGSVLWHSHARTQLEGVGVQFPTDSSDFGLTHRHAPHAGWELQVDMSDPEALFMSAVRLTLNSAEPAMSRLMSGGSDESTKQLLRTLDWDVTRQLVHHALRCEEVASLDVDMDAVSLAGVLRNLVATIWPRESVVTLRRWLDNDPPRIETRLQHFRGLTR
ncbi:MAG: hypothetical protein WBH03_04510 [Cyclobacteriaceae bacterium]